MWCSSKSRFLDLSVGEAGFGLLSRAGWVYLWNNSVVNFFLFSSHVVQIRWLIAHIHMYLGIWE